MLRALPAMVRTAASRSSSRRPAIRIRTRTEFGGAGWPDLFFNLRSGQRS